MTEPAALKDPLIAALVAKLPAPGTAWPGAQRVNWLRMLVMGFNETYGLEDPITVTDTPAPRPGLRLVQAIENVHGEEITPDMAARAKARVRRFTIDPEGFAMSNGQPIDPEDIPAGEAIYDERPSPGDLEGIYWKTGGVRKPETLPKLNLQAA